MCRVVAYKAGNLRYRGIFVILDWRSLEVFGEGYMVIRSWLHRMVRPSFQPKERGNRLGYCQRMQWTHYYGIRTMTREDIIRMARDAGWNGIYAKPLFSIYMQETNFLHFAALVAAAEREKLKSLYDQIRFDEREECAKLVDANADACVMNSTAQMVLRSNAAALRARGK